MAPYLGVNLSLPTRSTSLASLRSTPGTGSMPLLSCCLSVSRGCSRVAGVAVFVQRVLSLVLAAVDVVRLVTVYCCMFVIVVVMSSRLPGGRSLANEADVACLPVVPKSPRR